MTDKTLFVPMQVDGLYIKAGVQSVGPSADFSRLPHLARDSDGDVYDANATQPFLMETASDPPFSDETRHLEAGVHLHWAMPDMLTRATHPGEGANKNRNELVFPSVPNRWLVQRRVCGMIQAGWVIESDYIWPPDYPWGQLDWANFVKTFGLSQEDKKLLWKQLKASGWVTKSDTKDTAGQYRYLVARKHYRVSTALGIFALRRAEIEAALVKHAAAPNSLRNTRSSYLFPNETSDGFTDPDNPPYRLLGRSRELGKEWDAIDTEPTFTPKTKIGNLTAVGWGEPSFAAFYPNCRSMFGFHDDIDASAKGYSYDVYGWFSDGGEDLMAKAPDDPEKAASWLKTHLQWTATDSNDSIPKRMICFGRVSSDRFVPEAPGDLNGKPAPKSKNDIKPGMTVAVANTGTEALSAVLASDLALARHGARVTERTAEKRKIENYLEALHVTSDLNHRQLDVGAKFEESRREKTFTAFPGGHIWTLQPESDTQDVADAKKRPHSDHQVLTQDLSADLSALNISQRKFEHAQRSLIAVRRQVLFDWQRYMRYAYPHDDEALNLRASRDEHDLDAAIAFLRHGSMQYLQDLEAGAGTLAADIDQRVKNFKDTLDRENKSKPEFEPRHDWKLKTVPAPRFYEPNDPVILLANGQIEPSDRNGHDHGIDGDQLLECFALTCAPPINTEFSSDDTLRAVANQASHLFEKLRRDPGAKVGVRKKARSLGHPFLLEWEAAIAQATTSRTADNNEQRYSPEYIRKNWHLNNLDPGLKKQQTGVTLPSAAQVVRGRGYLTPHADRLLYKRIDAYVTSRMDEFYDAFDISKKIRGPDYLQENYAEVRTWMVSKGVDRLAADAARELMRMQKAVPDGAVFGIARDGTIGEMIRLAVNSIEPAKLVSLAGLSELEAQTIALWRSGATSIYELVFKWDGDKAPPLTSSVPDLRPVLLTTLEIDADLRDPLTANFEAFLEYLTGETSKKDLGQLLKVNATILGRLPPAHKSLATLVTVLRNYVPEAVNLAGDLGSAENVHPFTSYSELSDLWILREQAGNAGAALAAKLLRFAQSNGYFGALDQDAAYLQEFPPVMGLPVGGPIEREILRYVTERLGAGDDRLTTEAGVADFVVTELKLHSDISSLTDLAAIDFVSDGAIAHILRAADRGHYFVRSSALNAGKDEIGTVGDAMFATRASAGHAWSDPILTALDAWVILKSGFMSVTQNLSGFNDALLMKRKRWQLPVSDPIGFLDYRAFTEKNVRDIVGDAEADAIPIGSFFPIRSGGMSLSRVRLVDTFGQITDIQAPHVITATGMEGTHSHEVTLPPRITQAARLNFRWLDGISGAMEWNKHPDTTPVCGWVVLNNLEGRLMIHETSGAPLGSLDLLGAWHPAPGATNGVTSPDDITNVNLRRLVKWMLEEAARGNKASSGFMTSFHQICETALENIDPEGSKNTEARSLLMGRPMAVVRASVAIECRDPLAIDQGMAAFGKEVQGAPRNTHGFENVLFPVRIGEHMQLNDGVIGFLSEDQNGFEVTHYTVQDAKNLTRRGITKKDASALGPVQGKAYETKAAFIAAIGSLIANPDVTEQLLTISAHSVFSAPQSDWMQGEDLAVSRKGRDDLNLWIPISTQSETKNITVLMDPRGSLHASTSALPIKEIDIPPNDYVHAMNRISISLMAAPVLTDRGQVNLPLAREAGWSWSWISKSGTDWTNLPSIPKIHKSAFEQSFDTKNTARIWDKLIAASWIKPVEGSQDTAVVLPKPSDAPAPKTRLRNGRDQEDLKDLKDLEPQTSEPQPIAETILRIIETNCHAIGPVSTAAHFAKQEIIEGWMLLSPTDKAHYSKTLNGEDTP